VPVIINEIEVLDQPAQAASGTAAAPAPAPAPNMGERVLQLVRDADGRQRRLTAN
jgi:hypothetical protein